MRSYSIATVTTRRCHAKRFQPRSRATSTMSPPRLGRLLRRGVPQRGAGSLGRLEVTGDPLPGVLAVEAGGGDALTLLHGAGEGLALQPGAHLQEAGRGVGGDLFGLELAERLDGLAHGDAGGALVGVVHRPDGFQPAAII